MNTEKTSLENENQPSCLSAVSKRKYWYRDDVEVCVLCGKETHNKERVYNENEKGKILPMTETGVLNYSEVNKQSILNTIKQVE